MIPSLCHQSLLLLAISPWTSRACYLAKQKAERAFVNSAVKTARAKETSLFSRNSIIIIVISLNNNNDINKYSNNNSNK